MNHMQKLHRRIQVQRNIADLYELPMDAIQDEFFDFLKIVANGAKKYDMNNWLEPDGKSTSHEDMHNKMFRHLARSFANHGRKDKESGEDHLLHLITRAVMYYTRHVKGIKHPKDTEEGTHALGGN